MKLNTSISLRKATVEDSYAIAEILVSAWKAAYSDFMPAELLANGTDLQSRSERLRIRWDSSNLHMVTLDELGAIRGYALEKLPPQIDGVDCEIAALYVHPQAARIGHGRALFEHFVSRFTEMGCESMAIHTLVQNQIGRSFYKKMGGEEWRFDEWNKLPAIWYRWPNIRNISDT